MKHFVLFCLTAISFVSYSMHNRPLLLESAERVYKRNAREIQSECVDCINFIHITYPGILNPEDFKDILTHIRQSQITTEDKKEALDKIQATKAIIVREAEKRKKEEEENYRILEHFGVIDNGSRKKPRIH